MRGIYNIFVFPSYIFWHTLYTAQFFGIQKPRALRLFNLQFLACCKLRTFPNPLSYTSVNIFESVLASVFFHFPFFLNLLDFGIAVEMI